MSDQKKHHENAPSSAGAIWHCNQYVPTGNSDGPFNDADVGTEIHRWLELMFKGIAPPVDSFLTQDQQEATIESYHNLNNFIKAKIPGIKPEQIQTEIPITITDQKGNIISEGTADLFASNGKVNIVSDHKANLGFNMKNSYHKPQTAHYGLGAMQKFNLKDVIFVENHVLPDRLIPYDLTREMAEATVQAVWLRRYRDKKVHTCNYYCRYCAKITNCPAIKGPVEGFGCHVPENILDMYKNLDKVDTGKDMSDLLISIADQVEQYQKKLKRIVDNVKAAGVALSNQGIPIPHFERSAKTTQTVKEVFKAYDLVPAISKVQFEKSLKLSIPALSKEYKAAMNDSITLKVAKGHIEAFLMPVTERSTTYSLKRKLER